MGWALPWRPYARQLWRQGKPSGDSEQLFTVVQRARAWRWRGESGPGPHGPSL
jgi:hypothetical protein